MIIMYLGATTVRIYTGNPWARVTAPWRFGEFVPGRRAFPVETPPSSEGTRGNRLDSEIRRPSTRSPNLKQLTSEPSAKS